MVVVFPAFRELFFCREAVSVLASEVIVVVVSIVGFDGLLPFFFGTGRTTFGGDGGTSLTSHSGRRAILLLMTFDT